MENISYSNNVSMSVSINDYMDIKKKKELLTTPDGRMSSSVSMKNPCSVNTTPGRKG